MRTTRSILRILGFLFLLFAVWTLVFVAGTIIREQPNKNLAHVPSDVIFALRIDGRQLTETALFSIILESKDEEIVRLMDKMMRKGLTGDKVTRNTGINYLSDIVVFTLPYNGNEVRGILVNTLNQRAFLKNIPETLEKGQVCAAQNSVGVILTSVAGNKKMVTEFELQKLATKIVQQKESEKYVVFARNAPENQISELWLHSKTKNEHQEMSLQFAQKGQSFSLSGDFISEETEFHELSHQLKPKGFHVTSRIFAKEWADSLKSMLAFIPADLPTITAFSLNFEGCSVINHSTGFFVVPNMEMIIQCEEPFSIENLFGQEELKSELDYQIGTNYISFQDEKLFFKQLTSSSFYIGKAPNPSLEKRDKKELVRIEGSLEPLLLVKGGGLMTAFLEMLPIFRASKQLSKSSEKLQISVVRGNNQKAHLEGELKFKEGKLPMSEVFRFLLVGQIVK